MPLATKKEISFVENRQSVEGHDQQKLAELIQRFTPCDGSFELPYGKHIQALKVTKTSPESNHVLSKPGMCIVAQGAKRVVIGQDAYEYDESRLVVYSSEVPVSASIIKASRAEPYLCLVVPLDYQRIAEMVQKVFPNGLPRTHLSQPIYIGKSNPDIINAAIRLLTLTLEGDDADLLIPLIIDEMLIRLLRSSAGPSIAQIAMADSNAYKVVKGIQWLKANFAEPMKVEELAEFSNMSTSSFHHHFKALTSMSPLRFQKNLRLQEARRLMSFEQLDIATASLQVGYSSVSQFSREYSRLFGKSPAKDIAQLLESRLSVVS